MLWIIGQVFLFASLFAVVGMIVFLGGKTFVNTDADIPNNCSNINNKIEKILKDPFGFRKELKLFGGLLALYAILLMTNLIVSNYIYDPSTHWNYIDRWYALFLSIWFSLLITSMIFYPYYFFKKQDKICKLCYSMNKHQQSLKLGWQNVVTTYRGFESFMNHLQLEFSTENLLFIQEVSLHCDLN